MKKKTIYVVIAIAVVAILAIGVVPCKCSRKIPKNLLN